MTQSTRCVFNIVGVTFQGISPTLLYFSSYNSHDTSVGQMYSFHFIDEKIEIQ